MKNRDFIKGLGNISAWVTAALFIYPLIVGFIILKGLMHHEPNIDGWVMFSAIPSVYLAWFMSWVTGTLWETSNDYT